MDISKYRALGNKKIDLSKIDTGDTDKYHSKNDAKEKLDENIARLAELQEVLYANDHYSVLLILQAMDTAGKDGIIKHVMKGLNPQGTHVRSFIQPSAEELDHDYLWRVSQHLPERGQIGIFNRSYYEEVLVVRVHDLVKDQHIPPRYVTDKIWQDRYKQIHNYEKYLTENGIVILKFFLHISKNEQKERLLERIEDKSKNWKFSAGDITERKFWNQYQQCYEEAISETTTDEAPWYIIPADKKWFARLIVSEIIVQSLEKLNLSFPTLNEEQNRILEECKMKLQSEES
jgi:PPK2 family polyphosphate:nucleotide phosphotransferase